MIEEFMDFEDFHKILDQNEDFSHDEIFETAWDNAVDTVAEKFQSLFFPRDNFHYPKKKGKAPALGCKGSSHGGASFSRVKSPTTSGACSSP